MPAEAENPLRLELVGPVAHLVLDRPRQLNAFTLPLAKAFLQALRTIAEDPAVRVVVLRGAGRAFSAGGDVKQMLGDVERGDRAAYFREPLAAFNEMALALRRLPKPALAAVHGAVAGVAFNLMLAADLRLAAASTRFTQAFVRLALSPDGGGTRELPRLVGYARACELTMLPTELDAKTALDWGLVNWVVPDERLDEETAARAATLARMPAGALSRAKVLLNLGELDELASQMEAERLAQIANSESPDFDEGLRAFVEKREPAFNRG